MTRKIPTAAEIFAKARDAQYDSLGFTSDPELVMTLVIACRRRAFAERKAAGTLSEWGRLLTQVLAEKWSGSQRDLLNAELFRYGWLCKKLGTPLLADLAPRVAAAEKAVPVPDLTGMIEAEWRSGMAAAAPAAATAGRQPHSPLLEQRQRRPRQGKTGLVLRLNEGEELQQTGGV